MKPGPLFRLLGLRRALCPSCHRDNIWRVNRQAPMICRWCGSLMVDFDLIRRVVDQVTEFLAGPFLEAVRRADQQMAQFMRALTLPVELPTPPPPGNPLDSAIRMRRLPSDPLPQPPQETD